MTADDLWSLFRDLDLWGVVLVSAALGFAGGALHALTPSPTGADPPAGRVPRWVREGLVGIIAAIGAIAVMAANREAPTSGIEWIAVALFAGFAGDALVAGFTARFTAGLAQRKAEDAERRAEAARDLAEARRAQAAELVTLVENQRAPALAFEALEKTPPESPFASLLAHPHFGRIAESVRAPAFEASTIETLSAEYTWSEKHPAHLETLEDNGVPANFTVRTNENGRLLVTWPSNRGTAHLIKWTLVFGDKKLTKLKADAWWPDAAHKELAHSDAETARWVAGGRL